MENYNHYSTSVGNNYKHVQLTPKCRYKMMRKEKIKVFCKVSIEEACKKHKIEIVILKVMDDHVHMFISAPPKYSPAQIVQIMKRITAREMFRIYPLLREQYWAGEMWADGYYVGTAGHDVTKDMIKKIIVGFKSLKDVEFVGK